MLPSMRCILALLITLTALPSCRWIDRRSPTKILPPTTTASTTQPISTPLPPDPPPLPSPPPALAVSPPKAENITSGIVPPMPTTAGPTPIAMDLPITAPLASRAQSAAELPRIDQLQPVQAIEGEVDGLDGPLKQRLEEQRKKREERREERKERRKEPKDPKDPADSRESQEPAAVSTPQAPPATDVASVRAKIDAATQRVASVTDFEATLVKRELVNGKAMPQSTILYRYRAKPLSVYMRVIAGAGVGREVLYVQGQHNDRVYVVTGEGDNRLVGAGFKTNLDPNDKQLTAKSRYKATEAGLNRTTNALNKILENSKTGPLPIKALGLVKRPEYPELLDGLEVTLRPGDDPLLPKGGKRLVFFDAKKESQSYLLPVVIITTEIDGREAEYYVFDRFKIPSNAKEIDWNPSSLGSRK